MCLTTVQVIITESVNNCAFHCVSKEDNKTAGNLHNIFVECCFIHQIGIKPIGGE